MQFVDRNKTPNVLELDNILPHPRLLISVAARLIQIIMTQGLPLVHNSGNRISARRISHITIMRDVEATAQVLGADESENDHVSEDTAHEDADDFAVIVPFGLAQWWQGEALADSGFDG